MQLFWGLSQSHHVLVSSHSDYKVYICYSDYIGESIYCSFRYTVQYGGVSHCFHGFCTIYRLKYVLISQMILGNMEVHSIKTNCKLEESMAPVCNPKWIYIRKQILSVCFRNRKCGWNWGNVDNVFTPLYISPNSHVY